MNTVDQLRSDISSLSSFCGLREREFTARRDEIANALKSKKEELVAAKADLARRSRPPFFKELGVMVGVWSIVVRTPLARLRARQLKLETDIRNMIRDGRTSEQSRKTMSGVVARLAKTESDIRDLDHPPTEIADRLKAISAAVEKLSKRKDPKAIVTAARDIVVTVDAWANAGRMSRRGGGENEGRIWLPIPFSMSYQANALGAKQDMTMKGASRFYVDVGTPLARFNALLPHAFRETRPKLKFSAIRANAQRQNIWSFMDSLSWDHVRNVNYAMTGKRCILCGKQSGKLVSKLEPDKPNKVGSVECHEVWNWTRPDPDLPVGIQSLERIMVVCFDCHMCFHDDVARGKALAHGDADFEKNVQKYLLQRRSFLTNTSIKDIALEMQAENQRLADHKGVTTWIVDLTKLAKQDYMYGQTPTLLSNNPAGVKASQVAGITFRDQDGVVHPAVSPERLYQDIAMKWIRQPEPTFQVVGGRR